ncbi:hypothetical protein PC9H_008982 [Pleurotus ostreatus]|uniref:KOW domain-containing protein n=1 Tax=Pleurotus ostreatus TaxID=5322 RepID=A0A8H6ZQ11_PLEOS|nr:uncharacterized protein PC9H_008982 [Pleurotus ostreatus]KAF7426613.1 hypothetical protein PC9H_008982 [Pleurotus ostreatus]
MLPGQRDEHTEYHEYVVGPGDRAINFNYDDDPQIHEDMREQEPAEWPNDLFSPYDEATTYQLLQDLKQAKAFVCRVLVKPWKEVEVIQEVVLKNPEARTRIFSHRKVKGVVYVLPRPDMAEIDNFFNVVSGPAVLRTESGATIKEALSHTETKVLLFKQENPAEPNAGGLVRIHGDDTYENLMAFVVEVEPCSQVAHLLVLRAPYKYVGNEPEYDGFPSARIPELVTENGQLAHDGRMYAFGLIRGKLPFDCLQCGNICPTFQEIEALERCPYDPVRQEAIFHKRNQVSNGDLVRIISGRYQGLVGWADDLRAESCGVMARPTTLAADTFGIEIAKEDLLRPTLKKGKDVLVIRGPFAGVKVKVVKDLDRFHVHAKVVKPSETMVRVKSWEIIKYADVGDYVEVESGPYKGCQGYVGADQWQAARVFVDDLVERHLGDITLLHSWVVVNYNDLKTIQTCRTVAPTAPIEEESKGGSLLQRSLAGMEVAIVYHKFLKGTTGRIISSSIIESKRGKRRLVYNVGKLRDNSSYTYQVKERHLRELSTGLPIVIAARLHMIDSKPTEARTPTPPIVEDEQLACDFVEHALRERVPFAVDTLDSDNHYDETIQNNLPEQSFQRGAWILHERLRHKKLEVHISGTRDKIVFRQGKLEGKDGYLVVTSRIYNVEASVLVKIDSSAREPTTRIPVKYLSPKYSDFPIGTRVVIIGGEVQDEHSRDHETWIGSYGVVAPCAYDLHPECRMVAKLNGKVIYIDRLLIGSYAIDDADDDGTDEDKDGRDKLQFCLLFLVTVT